MSKPWLTNIFTKYNISSAVATLLEFPLVAVVEQIYVYTHTCKSRKENHLVREMGQEKEVINMDGYVQNMLHCNRSVIRKPMDCLINIF